MTFDKLDANLDKPSLAGLDKLETLRDQFKTGLEAKNGVYLKVSEKIADNVIRWLDIPVDANKFDINAYMLDLKNAIKVMYDGVPLDNGRWSLGMKEIHEWNINPKYEWQNVKQHAGFMAEIISTWKENLISIIENTGITTQRADDRPDLFQRNDQYVDKIRIKNVDGEEKIERIQVKFVGNNPSECLEKLMSKGYDKFFNDGKVDKIEVPKDYYDGIKELLPEKIGGLEQQLQRVMEAGNTAAVEKIEMQISRCHKIDTMLEKSTVTVAEAIEAVKDPEGYLRKLFE